jgi:hypothetical protein
VSSSSTTTKQKNHQLNENSTYILDIKDHNSVDDTTTTTTTTTTIPGLKSNPSFLIHLVGEFGNHLEYMARGIVLQKIAQTGYNLNPKLILKQQIFKGKVFRKKAVPTQNGLQRCFPYFQQFDFKEGNSNAMNELMKIQNDEWMFDGKSKSRTILNLVNGNKTEMNLALQHIKELSIVSDAKDGSTIRLEDRMKLPIVNITYMNVDFREHIDKIRAAFSMNEQICCKEVPHEDETVFVSFTNFLAARYLPFLIAFLTKHLCTSALSQFCWRNAISSSSTRFQ